MLTAIKLSNFRGFNNFTIKLSDVNILVGANNAGKSTIIDALRAFGGAYRYISRKRPELINLPDIGIVQGYTVPRNSIPINIENVRRNYQSLPAIITYYFDTKDKLIIIFTPDDYIHMYIDSKLDFVNYWSIKYFANIFKSDITIVPSLGQVDTEEEIHDNEYVQRWQSSHRAYRFFRNWWYNNQTCFNDFKMLVESTWPGMSIKLPEKDYFNNRITMFCVEDGIDRELSWSGSGFQIWLQMLTHIISGNKSDLVVVDEPEIYLHADLQRKLLKLLKSNTSRIVIATHSIEIINDAEPEDILIIDKSRKHANRLSEVRDMQQAAELLGSSHNIHLTKLAKGRKVLFVEGKEKKVLEKLSGKVNMSDVIINDKLTIIPLGGFTQWENAINSDWAFKNVLDENIDIMLLLDRDFRTQMQIDDILKKADGKSYKTHILKRKEIENYLLVPEAIESALMTRAENIGVTLNKDNGFTGIEQLLFEVSDSYKAYMNGQYLGGVMNDYNQSVPKPSEDITTIVQRESMEFEKIWANLESRLAIIPGKDFVGRLSATCQAKWKISISNSSIIYNMKRRHIPDELMNFFRVVANFVGYSDYED